MSMRALVRPHRKFGDVALQRVIGELDLGRAIFPSSRWRVEEGQSPRIRNQAAFIAVAPFPLAGDPGRTPTFADLVRSALEELFLAVVAVGEDEVVVENER